MKAVIQRVSRAKVKINASEERQTGRGLVVLLGIGENDTEAEARWLSDKITGLRIFPGEDGKFSYSAADIRGDLLIIPQFTLYGNCAKGKRPDFIRAARAEKAEPLYKKFVEFTGASGLNIKTGEFASDMLVEIFNDGPVTIIIDTDEKNKN